MDPTDEDDLLEATAPEDPLDDGIDLNERRLCPDGNCLGLIGANGRCKLCGREAGCDEGDVDTRRQADGDEDDEPRGEAGGAREDDFAARALCPDGNCVGVLGADGRCKICGLPATDADEI